MSARDPPNLRRIWLCPRHHCGAFNTPRSPIVSIFPNLSTSSTSVSCLVPLASWGPCPSRNLWGLHWSVSPTGEAYNAPRSLSLPISQPLDAFNSLISAPTAIRWLVLCLRHFGDQLPEIGGNGALISVHLSVTYGESSSKSEKCKCLYLVHTT